MKPLVLASTSPYRKELLSRLMIDFVAVSPDFDEVEVPGLTAQERALHNARGKSESLVARFPDRIIIGSDQTAELDGEILGKPGSIEAAMLQLDKMSARRVVFHTGLAVIGGGAVFCECVPFAVTLRKLNPEAIYSYVQRELPINCAGSFKIEGLGIALMEKLEGEDYTSLIGLPLIRLTRILQKVGVDVLAAPKSARSSCL